MRLALALGLALAGALGGCSSAGPSSRPSPSQPQQLPAISCPAALREAFAHSLATGAISVQRDISAGFSTCDYRSRAGEVDACRAATVTIDTNQQAFKDFQRWVVETTQNAGSSPGEGLAPVTITGIGTEANWVPGTLTFETATNSRWVAIRLTCPASRPQNLALAEALGRAALAAS